MNMGKSVIDFNEKKGFICDVDGDAFMNCTKLYMLVMRGSPKDKSCLKQILSQISTLMRVRWAVSDGNAIAQACFFE